MREGRRWLVRRCAILLWMAALAGCSELSHTVDKKLVRALGVSGRLAMLERESEVLIALDEAQQLRADEQELRDRISMAKRELNKAERDFDSAGSKNDEQGVAVATLAQAAFVDKIAYLEGAVELMNERITVQQRHVLAARARLELAKAESLLANSIVGAEELNVARFQQQVDDIAKRIAESQAGIDALALEVAALERVWQVSRGRLRDATRGALGSQWVEDGFFWGQP